jgi:hypothetical protein
MFSTITFSNFQMFTVSTSKSFTNLQNLTVLKFNTFQFGVNTSVITEGSSDFDKIFENCFSSCSFGLAKIYKTILEKAFFLIFWCFYLFSAFVLINFEIGPSQR